MFRTELKIMECSVSQDTNIACLKCSAEVFPLQFLGDEYFVFNS